MKKLSDFEIVKYSAALTDYIQNSGAVKREVTFFSSPISF